MGPKIAWEEMTKRTAPLHRHRERALLVSGRATMEGVSTVFGSAMGRTIVMMEAMKLDVVCTVKWMKCWTSCTAQTDSTFHQPWWFSRVWQQLDLFENFSLEKKICVEIMKSSNISSSTALIGLVRSYLFETFFGVNDYNTITLLESLIRFWPHFIIFYGVFRNKILHNFTTVFAVFKTTVLSVAFYLCFNRIDSKILFDLYSMSLRNIHQIFIVL